MNEIIYFELNNWFRGRDYPDVEPFVSWMNINKFGLSVFGNEDFVKENKLCVSITNIDMSTNYCITATKDWILNNCPSLLNEDSKFVVSVDKYGEASPRLGVRFIEYSKENIGIISWDEEED